MKNKWILICVILMLALAGCGGGDKGKPTPTNSNDPAIANPASVYCEEHGGKLEIRNTDAGQVGICVFTDGSECDEWQYFRGECSPGQNYPAP